MGILTVVAHIFLKFLRDGRGQKLFEAWRATFGPRATGWEPLIYIKYNFYSVNITSLLRDFIESMWSLIIIIKINLLLLDAIAHSLWFNPSKLQLPTSNFLINSLVLVSSWTLLSPLMWTWRHLARLITSILDFSDTLLEGREAEIQLPLKRSPDSQLSLVLIPARLVWRRTSGQQNSLLTVYHDQTTAWSVTKQGYSQNVSQNGMYKCE